MRTRKLVAIFLALGYLTAVQCRVACAFSMPVSAAAVEEQESDCHHEDGEPKSPASKKPCCMTSVVGAETLPPTDAPAIASRTVLSLVAIVPQAGPAVIQSRLLASSPNHDPPRIASEVLALSSLSARAPPAAVL